MTSRERWTIYPILFLTLGISMRDKITSTIDVESIRCESLVVTPHRPPGLPDDELPGPMIHMRDGMVLIYGIDETLRVSLAQSDQGGGQFGFFSTDKKELLLITGGTDGGRVQTFDAREAGSISLGYDRTGGRIQRIVLDDGKVQRRVYLSSPIEALGRITIFTEPPLSTPESSPKANGSPDDVPQPEDTPATPAKQADEEVTDNPTDAADSP